MFASHCVPHCMQGDLLTRFSRIEGSIMTLSGQVFQCQSATHSSLAQMHDQLQLMMSILLGNGKRSELPPQVSPQISPVLSLMPRAVAVCQITKLCPYCDASCKRCTATTSLRHMLSCDQFPATPTKHFLISEHLFNYKNEPLVGPMGECCWCGKTWDNCMNSSNSQSPKSADAQSKHKKSCHVTCHKALQSKNPETVEAAKAMLDRIWSNENVNNRRVKRERAVIVDDGTAMPPVVGEFKIDGFDNHESRQQSDDYSSDSDHTDFSQLPYID
jgi:hypothetical protein